MARIIRVDGCWNCPYYELYDGRENVYHTCRENQRTVKGDFMILFRFCELEELDE